MESSKKINIIGTNNRYMMKKVTHTNTIPHQRKESKKWNLSDEMYTHNNQLLALKNICNSLNEHTKNEYDELIVKQINKKISGYKQQDILKKVYNEEKFICLKNIIDNMIETELKCRYCIIEMLVLYDLTRESNQWTVDRVDNNLGHNIDNYYLSCLDCNLKKKRKSDEKFLFTKQLNIIKNENI